MAEEKQRHNITIPKINLPKGGGSISGLGEQFDANGFTGAATLSLPVPATAARELTPGLSINYNSSGGNGPFGMGFELALSSITRKTSTGIPRYNEQDIFLLDGQELTPQDLPVIQGDWSITVFRSRVESAFALIELYVHKDGNAYWKITSADNAVTIYGSTTASRIADPAQPVRIFTWLVDEITDSKGNKILYEYKSDDDSEGRWTNRYIHHVKYGNYFDEEKNEHFAFGLVFDHGEYDINDDVLKQPGCDPYVPVKSWLQRGDVFSSFRSGFCIRTMRLCRNILLFHSLPGLGEKPCLVRAVRLEHDETGSLSFLAAYRQTGYRRNTDGSYAIKEMPAVQLSYSKLDLDAPVVFRELKAGEGVLPPDPSRYSWVDIDGEGMPGLLYTDGSSVIWWAPEGDGNYSAANTVHSFPVHRDLEKPQYTITDIDGNGQKELLVTEGNVNGFYPRGNGKWQGFQPLRQSPVELNASYRELVDLNGGGLTDVVMLEQKSVKIYNSQAEAGFANADIVPAVASFPYQLNNYEQEFLGFADIFGDGLSHRVRITNGSVEVWPCLGYGKFGEKVDIANAPVLDEELDVSRLMLADIDGTGTTDIAYVHSDRVDIYFNRNGSSFSALISIPLPVPYSKGDVIGFHDVTGTGMVSLVYTKMEQEVKHYYFAFTTIDKEQCSRPNMLTGIVNNMGAVTSIYYTTSLQCYLRDRKEGRQWPQNVPFPVMVVERSVVKEEITGNSREMYFSYHDGFYDPFEKEFRGFGYVESLDTNKVPEGDVENIPPVLTKTWYHTGAYIGNGRISSHYRHEYFSGDKDALVLPESVFSNDILSGSGEAECEAYAALAGKILHTEVYGIDGSEKETIPYTTASANYEVRMLQQPRSERCGVYLVIDREHISFDYERNPSDPKAEHDFTLEADEYGNVILDCKVYYPRRGSEYAMLYLEQYALRCEAGESRYANYTIPFRRIGAEYEAKEYEIEDLDTEGKQYFSFDVIHAKVKEAISKNGARLLSWEKHYSWNHDQTGFLPLGELSAHGLAHHGSEAVFTEEEALRIYLSFFNSEEELDDALVNKCGYSKENGHWWSSSEVSFFNKHNGFYMLQSIKNALLAEDCLRSLRTHSEVIYDSCWLRPVEIRQYFDAANGEEDFNSVKAFIDLQTFQYNELHDVNGNVSQALYDPLGMLIAASVHSLKNGVYSGDTDLKDYTVQPASFTEVLNDPHMFLQGATSFFYYDLFAWSQRDEPASSISLSRQVHVSDLVPGELSPVEIGISYTDGLGRMAETKRRTTPGDAVHRKASRIVIEPSDERWIVSGKTIYNNKGVIAKQYLPYFTATPSYEEQDEVAGTGLIPPPEVFHYDPLLRVVRTDTPKGFFTKHTFTPWEEAEYDENDTVIESKYYIDNYNNPDIGEDERDALVKARRFYNTPSITINNNLGQPVRSIRDNLGAVQQDAFEDIVSPPVTSAELWNELVNKSYLELRSLGTTEAWVSAKFRPYEKGFELHLDEPYQQYADAVVQLLGGSSLVTFHQPDIEGQELRQADPRLYYSNVHKGTSYYNLQHVYDLAGQQLHIASADAGGSTIMYNMLGQPWRSWTERGFAVTSGYDRLQRVVETHVKGTEGNSNSIKLELDQITGRIVYGESVKDAALYNLRGQAYRQYDHAGIQTTGTYDLDGNIINASRVLRKDYRSEANWNEPDNVPLEKEEYNFTYKCNAVGGNVLEIRPDNTEVHKYYNIAGQPDKMSGRYKDSSTQEFVKSIVYNANGDREKIYYGNGSVTSYDYELTTQRLLKIRTTRKEGSESLQDISYTYDPAGNITRTRDHSQPSRAWKQQEVDPLFDYTYDAIYQITQAKGRQQSGASRVIGSTRPGKLYIPSGVASSNESTALENYSEHYRYDDGGNLVETRHVAASGSWSRSMKIDNSSNRGTASDSTETIYDAAGNTLVLNGGKYSWNYSDNISEATLVERGEGENDSEYYVYDAGGSRVRKVSVRKVSDTVTAIEESIYVANYIVTRKYNNEAITYEKRTNEIMDSKPLALINEVIVASNEKYLAGGRQVRWQLDNNLGSVSMETDDEANIITYEEYFPFGGTSIQWGSNETEVKDKLYRFSGKEKDATGLYYYGSRYYICWQGRWMNPDPAGIVDGLNLYAYVNSNPVTYTDPEGLAKSKAETNRRSTRTRGKVIRGDIDRRYIPATKRRRTGLFSKGGKSGKGGKGKGKAGKKKTAKASKPVKPATSIPLIPAITDIAKKAIEALLSSDKKQEALDKLLDEMDGRSFIKKSILEERFRDKNLAYKRSNTPKRATSEGKGIIYKPLPAKVKGTTEEQRKQVGGQAFPPGFVGSNAKPSEVEMYDFAFQGLPYLHSQVGHELKHADQNQKANTVLPLTATLTGTIYGQPDAETELAHMQEVETHHVEIMSSENTGLSTDADKMKERWNWFKYYWNKLSTTSKKYLKWRYDEAKQMMNYLGYKVR